MVPAEDDISIHTPAKGVTDVSWGMMVRTTISIHTPAKGVTDGVKGTIITVEFQSTLPRRE